MAHNESHWKPQHADQYINLYSPPLHLCSVKLSALEMQEAGILPIAEEALCSFLSLQLLFPAATCQEYTRTSWPGHLWAPRRSQARILTFWNCRKIPHKLLFPLVHSYKRIKVTWPKSWNLFAAWSQAPKWKPLIQLSRTTALKHIIIIALLPKAYSRWSTFKKKFLFQFNLR